MMCMYIAVVYLISLVCYNATGASLHQVNGGNLDVSALPPFRHHTTPHQSAISTGTLAVCLA